MLLRSANACALYVERSILHGLFSMNGLYTYSMIIDGKAIASQIQQEIKEAIERMPGRKPGLAVILVGTHAPSQIYVSRKTQACESVGIHSIRRELSSDITESMLLQEIQALNNNPNIDGILVQLPLPPHINPLTIIHHISPEKDVDGLHPMNVGKLLIGNTDGFVPCTPLGVKVLLERSGVDMCGKHALVIGRSNLVGKPMAALLMQNSPGANATVSLAHKYTKELNTLSQLADVLIVAIGHPNFITGDMIKKGSVIIDVGINKINDPNVPKGYRLVGDVDFHSVKNKCSLITPVPGGVGPMTIAMLLNNTLKSYERSLS